MSLNSELFVCLWTISLEIRFPRTLIIMFFFFSFLVMSHQMRHIWWEQQKNANNINENKIHTHTHRSTNPNSMNRTSIAFEIHKNLNIPPKFKKLQTQLEFILIFANTNKKHKLKNWQANKSITQFVKFFIASYICNTRFQFISLKFIWWKIREKYKLCVFYFIGPFNNSFFVCLFHDKLYIIYTSTLSATVWESPLPWAQSCFGCFVKF